MQVECIFATAGVDGSDGLLGIVIRKIADQVESGVKFFTSRDCSQQVGYMKHPKGHVIPPHIHARPQRVILDVPETLLVRKGRFLVNFYTSDRVFVTGRILDAEDVVVLLCGAHGFECMSDVEVYEVRQGPYIDGDKVRFEDKR